MIEVKDLYKSFEGKTVLKGVSLKVKDNETLVVLGPSGQGKTVLIKTMVRLLEADSGQVSYDGNEVLGMTKKNFQEVLKKIAFVFQNSALFDFLNVKDNLGLFLKMHLKKTDSEIWKEINEAIRFVGLDEDVLCKFPEELSGGMKKRVAIARAMIKKPRYIFYDEPTTGLDEGNAGKVSTLIDLLKNEISATSIIVTHDIKLMQDVSDRVILLKHGKIDFNGPQDKISNDDLSDLYDIGEQHEL